MIRFAEWQSLRSIPFLYGAYEFNTDMKDDTVLRVNGIRKDSDQLVMCEAALP